MSTNTNCAHNIQRPFPYLPFLSYWKVSKVCQGCLPAHSASSLSIDQLGSLLVPELGAFPLLFYRLYRLWDPEWTGLSMALVDSVLMWALSYSLYQAWLDFQPRDGLSWMSPQNVRINNQASPSAWNSGTSLNSVIAKERFIFQLADV